MRAADLQEKHRHRILKGSSRNLGPVEVPVAKKPSRIPGRAKEGVLVIRYRQFSQILERGENTWCRTRLRLRTQRNLVLCNFRIRADHRLLAKSKPRCCAAFRFGARW